MQVDNCRLKVSAHGAYTLWGPVFQSVGWLPPHMQLSLLLTSKTHPVSYWNIQARISLRAERNASLPSDITNHALFPCRWWSMRAKSEWSSSEQDRKYAKCIFSWFLSCSISMWLLFTCIKLCFQFGPVSLYLFSLLFVEIVHCLVTFMPNLEFSKAGGLMNSFDVMGTGGDGFWVKF